MSKQKRKPKYIFIVGGVLSGVGKGVSSASIGAIMQARGFSVTSLKADPYINVDAGTMSPTEHGEVFVTDDGDETDQDMGNYERFLNRDLTSINYMTTGRVYLSVINDERAMKYKGKNVEVVPDIPKEIIRRMKQAQVHAKADIVTMEIGGTVGEYQNLLFLEAARMMKMDQPDDVAVVLVSYLPIPKHIGEMKTKPTQYAARSLNSAGLQADFIIARGEQPLDTPRREKLATFCGVKKDHCLSAPDASSIYDVPLIFEDQQFSKKLCEVLSLPKKKSDLSPWQDLSKRIASTKKTVRIGVVGKYFGSGNFTLTDSYISVIEAIKHGAWYNGATPELTWIDAEEFETDPTQLKTLKQYDGILVPGGFGARGIEGIIATIGYARTNHIPYLGICYGMQLACVEFSRNVLKLSTAHTVEVDDMTSEPIIHVNPYQAKNIKENRYGGTMRLGAYDCQLAQGSIAKKAYGQTVVSERHRHRYEFNNAYLEQIASKGLQVTGVNPDTGLVEIVELDSHPFFVGVQFHPEFRSRPMNPHPLFKAFINACVTS